MLTSVLNEKFNPASLVFLTNEDQAGTLLSKNIPLISKSLIFVSFTLKVSKRTSILLTLFKAFIKLMSVMRHSGSLKNSANNFIDFKLHAKLSVLKYFIVASPCKASNNPF